METATADPGGGRLWRLNTTGGHPRSEMLHAKIGRLALEKDFLEGALIKAGLLSATR